jgi:hypothetical protein
MPRWLWTLAGALVAFGFLAILSIGLPFLLAGLILTTLLAGRGQPRPTPLAMGAGTVLIAIATINAGDHLFVPLLASGLALVGFAVTRCRRPAKS